jgi:serralysin
MFQEFWAGGGEAVRTRATQGDKMVASESGLGRDAAGNKGTPLTIGLDQLGSGRIGGANDLDWFKVDLVAGRTYTFTLVGTGENSLGDGKLVLRGVNGVTPLKQNDNGLQHGDAVITFTATKSGTHYLQVSGVDGATGDYGLTAHQGTKAWMDGAMIAGTVDSGWYWGETELTYGFRASVGGNGEASYFAFTDNQKVATRVIMAQTSDVCGLSFTEVNPGGLTDDATLLLANYDKNDGTGGYGWYPGSTASSSVAGDMWITGGAGAGPIESGKWDWTVIQHELGHNLGLSHPGDYAAGEGVRITYENNAQFLQDTEQYSVMSYFGAPNAGGPDLGADTWMLADVIALQQIYGVNRTTRTGDDVYGFGSTAGDVFDFDVNDDPLLTIWDAGGRDRLDLSGYAGDQVIDLRAGRYSSVMGYSQNVAIVPGAVIEDAVGGQVGDRMTGNGVGNHLQGIAGWDVLIGLAGADTLTGGIGRDKLIGGKGADVLEGGADAVRDVFVFQRLSDSRAAGARDRIDGFEGGIDVIDLRGVDADAGQQGNQVFGRLEDKAASHALWTKATAAGLLLLGDVNGDRKADFALSLAGLDDLRGADLLR